MLLFWYTGSVLRHVEMNRRETRGCTRWSHLFHSFIERNMKIEYFFPLLDWKWGHQSDRRVCEKGGKTCAQFSYGTSNLSIQESGSVRPNSRIVNHPKTRRMCARRCACLFYRDPFSRFHRFQCRPVVGYWQHCVRDFDTVLIFFFNIYFSAPKLYKTVSGFDLQKSL